MYRPLAFTSRRPLAEEETIELAALLLLPPLLEEKALGLWSAASITSAMVPNLFLFVFPFSDDEDDEGSGGDFFDLLLLLGGCFGGCLEVDDRAWHEESYNNNETTTTTRVTPVSAQNTVLDDDDCIFLVMIDDGDFVVTNGRVHSRLLCEV